MLPQVPPQAPPQPVQQVLQALGPFIEPEHDDDYFEEVLHNMDVDEPDLNWSDLETPFWFPCFP